MGSDAQGSAGGSEHQGQAEDWLNGASRRGEAEELDGSQRRSSQEARQN